MKQPSPKSFSFRRGLNYTKCREASGQYSAESHELDSAT